MNTAHQHSAALSGAVIKLRVAVQGRLPTGCAVAAPTISNHTYTYWSEDNSMSTRFQYFICIWQR
jgi:hypothetical protein